MNKFAYLKCLLLEPAKSVVSGFKLTSDNYYKAITLSKQRYTKPAAIKRAHINEWIGANAVYNEKSLDRLRCLDDHIETHLRGLQSLGVDQDSYSSIVVPLLMEKISSGFRLNMICSSNDGISHEE